MFSSLAVYFILVLVRSYHFYQTRQAATGPWWNSLCLCLLWWPQASHFNLYLKKNRERHGIYQDISGSICPASCRCHGDLSIPGWLVWEPVRGRSTEPKGPSWGFTSCNLELASGMGSGERWSSSSLWVFYNIKIVHGAGASRLPCSTGLQ